MNCRTALIDANIRWLRQALDLVAGIDDRAYATTPAGMAPHRAGGHLRHIVEFYQSFLDGLRSGRVDYDARRRDAAIESSRASASAAIRRIIGALETSAADRPILVRMEDAGDADLWMQSTVTRELQVLSSHTIHHFALMALTLRGHGIEMRPDFGMAPSTLRYLASRTAEAA
jgi:uncharacterized damage-inducible protein DinB